jgi:integrase
MASKKITALQVAKLTKPGNHHIGDGCYLQIARQGRGRSWLFRYQRDGRKHWVGLGPFALLSLAEARQRALDARRLLLDGIDPIEAKRSKRAQAALQAAKGITFEQCAERYIGAHETAWRNAVHRKQWRSTLLTYVFPVFGKVPVAEVGTALVMTALEPIWNTKFETAGRVRGRIESILDWAKARGYRDGENPARWRGHLDHLLPDRRKVRRVKHHAALPYAEIATFMAKLREREGVAARALEFAILTAGRTGEVLGARWDEISGDVWTVPASRMKSQREHRVPLSKRARQILDGLHHEGEYIFPGGRVGKPLSHMALLETLRRMNRGNLTAHGFRSTFRDWVSECTGYQREIAEAALAHAIPNAVEAAYRRGDLFEKRKRLMAEWTTYCSTAAVKTRPGGVVSIRGKGHG